mgnify:CR=1 FL=1
MLIYKEQLPEDTMDVRLLELPFSTVEAATRVFPTVSSII